MPDRATDPVGGRQYQHVQEVMNGQRQLWTLNASEVEMYTHLMSEIGGPYRVR